MNFDPELIQQSLSKNDSFSKKTLALQTSIDSTSLGAYKFCPTFYLYTIVMGFQMKRKNIDLQFGILVHSGVELYHHLRAQEISHEIALKEVIRDAQIKTWNKEKGRPELWDDSAKNRLSLIRLLVWYLDRWKDDPIETLRDPDGKALVEVNFHFPTSYESRDGEKFILCGYLDRIGKLNGEKVIPDIKTTRHQLDQRYFSQFTPDNQFSIYSLVARYAFQEPVRYVIVDACQVAATFVRFQREAIERKDEQLDEWYEDLGRWLQEMEESAEKLEWKMNDRMCWNCDFRSVCSRPRSARSQWLEANFSQRIWDPSKERTEA